MRKSKLGDRYDIWLRFYVKSSYKIMLMIGDARGRGDAHTICMIIVIIIHMRTDTNGIACNPG